MASRLKGFPLTLLNGHIFLIERRNKGSLRETVLEWEQLVPGDGGGARLQHGLGADGREVSAGAVTQRQRARVVLRAEQARRRALLLQLEGGTCVRGY